MKQLRPYKVVRLKKDHPYRSMCGRSGATGEHRLVMAEHIGRPLNSKEIVHHVDGNTVNNNISNLRLLSYKEHMIVTDRDDLRSYIPVLETKIQSIKDALALMERDHAGLFERLDV